jgi:hypothetical protein
VLHLIVEGKFLQKWIVTFVQWQGEPGTDSFDYVFGSMGSSLHLLPQNIGIFLEDYLENHDLLLSDFELFEQFLTHFEASVGSGFNQNMA